MASKKRPPITAIAFDLGNVLVKVDHGRFCARLGTLLHAAPREVFDAVFASDLEPRYDTGRLTSREFYQGVMARFNRPVPYSLFCHLWNDIFAPMEGMAEVVAALAQKLPLFLLSNTNALHFAYIRQRFPIVRHFQRFILSYEVGRRKPEGAIYQALIRMLGQAPEHCLYVDDKEPFVAAAEAHGLQAWHFTTPRDFLLRLARRGLW